MHRLIIMRWLLASIALFAYAANGAQAHVMIHSGETVTVAMCGVSGKTITLEIEGDAPEEMVDTCCGDCTYPPALMRDAPRLPPKILPRFVAFSAIAIDQVSPKSPLWPGAPPQGPPVFHKT